MANEANEAIQIPSLAWPAYEEFNEFLDFVWKAPSFIEAERKIEHQKLKVYFPVKGKNKKELAKVLFYRAWRKEREFKKLDQSFPMFMNSANLFAAVSLFEAHMMKLCHFAESFYGKKLQDQKGQGFSKIAAFLKRAGVKRDIAEYYEQVESAIIIRNCLMHAKGLIDWSRDKQRILEIFQGNLHLTKHTRDYMETTGKEFASLIILKTEYGPELRLPDQYVHVAAGCLRDHIVDVARQLVILSGVERQIDSDHPRGRGDPGLM